MDKPYFVIKPYKKDRKLERYMEKVRRDLSKFFGIKAILPRVFFIDSRKLYDQLLQIKTESWLVGKADGHNIFIFDKKNMTKYSQNNYKDRFWKVLKHEYSHIIFMTACRTTAPAWLNDGLACYLANQINYKPDVEKALTVLNYYIKFDKFIYQVGYF